MPSQPLTVRWGQFAGLNNRVDAPEVPQAETRYVYKPPYLSRARNIDLDSQGRPRRRPGYTLKLAGNYHSLYSSGDLCVAVAGGYLTQIYRDWTTRIIRGGMGSDTVSYARVNNLAFYSNPVAIGYLSEDGTNHGFADPAMNFKVAPFPGKFIEWYRGRLYIAKGNTLWFTDPLHLRIDMRKGFKQLPTPIVMVKAVDDGIFVSDEEATYFISGPSPEKMRLDRKEDAAIEGTGIVINANKIKGEAQGRALLFATKNGICVGMGNGSLKNVTGDNYQMPDVSRGASIVQDSADTSKLIMRLY